MGKVFFLNVVDCCQDSLYSDSTPHSLFLALNTAAGAHPLDASVLPAMIHHVDLRFSNHPPLFFFGGGIPCIRYYIPSYLVI